ncbi:MAG TPA: bifunctional serine/threonine-protein kinase/formylglycine-generating enzyme family protein [Anaerolineaceae bacterium]|nr:bifunctional serine/threonine-protein kinase/formylglycine-generating enzyme family protein [Anaerolineaceae bacterium]
MPTFQPDDIVLRDYKIETFIGEGGFGEVYQARDLNLNEPVALKILRRTAETDAAYYERARDRFTLEARLGHRITHPNIIRVYKFAPDDTSGLLVLVMEYAPGGSLADKLKSGLPAVPDALWIARQVAAGLGALHHADVVHRDLKPSNILFDATGTARVADLGLAQPASAIQVSQSSSGGGQLYTPPGTPAYMSPEQEGGRMQHLPPASDIYALGLILFEMLTGRTYKNQPPGTRLSQLRPEIPLVLDELVAAMLADDPKERPWDGAAAEKALQELSADEPVAPPVDAIPARTAATSSRVSATPTWTLEEGLSALKDMEEAQDWQLASELLDELEAAYPNHPKLKLPHKKIPQAEERARREAEEQELREIEEMDRREAEEKANRYMRRDGDRILIKLDAQQEMVFVRIPAGKFLMGSNLQNRVTLPEYWMGLAPVTNAQYWAFILEEGRKAPGHWQNNRPPQDKMNHPVVNVDSFDAYYYCKWLHYLTGLDVALPKEEEWEKAARGTDGRIYPWGDQAPDAKHCNFNQNVKDTTPVGRYSPVGDSPYGCVDMAGNVWEWCADSVYHGQVMRGGSWRDDLWQVRATYSRSYNGSHYADDLGFRCLLSLNSELLGFWDA